jgi:hypothetical protein
MASGSLMQIAVEQIWTDTEPDDSGLGIGHLQLSPIATSALLSAKLQTIADVLIFATSSAFASFDFREELIESLGRLGTCTTGNVVDWRKYWIASGMCFHHLSACLPELDRLSPWSANLPLSVDALGKAALPLSRAGFTTLGQLRDGLRAGISNVHGLGPGRRAEFFDRLISIANRVDNAGDVRHSAWVSQVSSNTDQLAGSVEARDVRDAQPIDPLRDLSPVVRALPVGVLHIGQKAMWFGQAGLSTIGQLSAVWPISMGQVPNIGASTIDLVGERFTSLMASAGDGEAVDWKHYSDLIGAAFVPEQIEFGSGDAFLASLPSVVSQIADRLEDPLEAAILLRRIAMPPGQQETLDDLARASTPRVTRERVRQKERGLLRDLARGLIWDDYGNLGIHFHPEFSARWKAAAAWFQGSDEITFADFVDGLSEVWGVSAEAVIQQAPIIMAIVTGDAQVPANFRSGFRIDARYYGPLPVSTSCLKLRVLRLGKYAEELLEHGIETVDDLIDCCRTGRISEIESRASRQALAQLAVLASCFADDCTIDWAMYRELQKMPAFPDEPPRSAAEFVLTVADEIEGLLCRSGVTGRAAEIFRLRTSRSLSCRPTLEQIGEQLETHGSSVKREETVFLQFLNDLLIERDYASAPVWLDETWLNYWRAANEVYLASSVDFDIFARQLSSRWCLSSSAYSDSLPTLWAVLSGYPDGRSPRRKRGQLTAKPAESVADTGRIKLTGFARLH